MKELPYQTYERILKRRWPGGKSKDIIDLLNKYGIKYPAGSQEANLELQKKLLELENSQSSIQQKPEELVQNLNNEIEVNEMNQKMTQPINNFSDLNENLIEKIRLPRDIKKEIFDERVSELNEEKMKERESYLNALEQKLNEIDNLYNQRIAEIEKMGKAEKARASAIALRSGLAGSPFGESYVKNVEDYIKKEKDILMQEMAFKKAAIRSEVAQALDNIEKRYKENLFNIKKQKEEYLLEIQKKALDDFKTLTKDPKITFNLIKQNKKLLNSIKEQTGYDENYLEFIFNVEASNNKLRNDVKLESKIENGNLIVYWYDKLMDELKTKIIPIDQIDQKNIKGGGYDLKISGNNLVLIPKEGINDVNDIIIKNLKEESNKSSGNKLTLNEAKNLGLPMSLVGMNEEDLAKSIVSDTAPLWFKKEAENRLKASVSDYLLQKLWNEFKNKYVNELNVFVKKTEKNETKTKSNYVRDEELKIKKEIYKLLKNNSKDELIKNKTNLINKFYINSALTKEEIEKIFDNIIK